MIDKWSPELIGVKEKESGECPIHHECLYHWILESKHGNKRAGRKFKKLYKYLKHGKRRRKRGNSKDRRGVIHNRVPFEKRPKIVDKRNRLENIALDLKMEKNHKGAMLVMTDWARLYTKIKNQTVDRVLDYLQPPLKSYQIATITCTH